MTKSNPPKMSKKDFVAALQPLRKAAERLGLSEMNATKRDPADLALFRNGVDFHGYIITVRLIKKARISNGIPAPYNALQIHYTVTHPVHGQIVAGWAAPEVPGQFFGVLVRRGLSQHVMPEAVTPEAVTDVTAS